MLGRERLSRWGAAVAFCAAAAAAEPDTTPAATVLPVSGRALLRELGPPPELADLRKPA